METTGTNINTGTGTSLSQSDTLTTIPDMVPDFYMFDELLLGSGFTFPDPNPHPSPSLSPVLEFLEDPKPELENQTQLFYPNNSNLPIKDRLSHALKFITDSQYGHEYLVQIWVPTMVGDKKVLTTINQPYQIGTTCDNLASYRTVSQNYRFCADESSEGPLGLPGRVFVGRMPEWTPDVRFFKEFEYPRVKFAEVYEIKGSIALPFFERGNTNCLGVVELVMTKRKVNYGPEIDSICNALQSVNLTSSEVQTIPRLKLSESSYQSAIPEIQTVLKSVCTAHNLPLAQTWMLCTQQGKRGFRHSDENYSRCISTVDSASFVRDLLTFSFHQSCSDHHLFKGEGIVGRAFLTNQPVFSHDITNFSKVEYSLAHHAKLFNLRGAVAIRLRSVETGRVDFVLEFFLPVFCVEIGEQRELLDELSLTVQRSCRSLRVVTQREMEEEDSSCYVMEAPVKDGMEGFSVTPGGWEDGYSEFGFSEEFAVKEEMGFGGGAVFGESSFLNGDKPNEKKHNKSEKIITLQDLRKHFAGSLKDAAKNLGVCPTTLKRVCRQNGISRWPSRKIKKVGHSLKKLQLVIDSVHGGPDGTVQLSNLYDNFTKTTWRENQDLNRLREGRIVSSSASVSSSSGSQSTVTPPRNTVIPLKRESSIEENKSEKKHELLKVKAKYGEEKVIFRLQPNWGFEDLRREVARRFGFADSGSINLKYLDDESEWVLLTCDADMHECLDVYQLSSARSIKILVGSSSVYHVGSS